MSVQTVQGSSALYHATHLSPDFSVVCWYRRDVDTGNDEFIVGNGAAGTGRTLAQIVGATDIVRLFHSPVADPLTLVETTGVWHYLLLTYQGETTPGSSADGVATLKYLNDGDSAFQETAQLTGVSDTTWEAFVIGVRQGASLLGGFTGTFAVVKAWTGLVMSDADALTERLSIPAQTNLGTLSRDYRFASGALTVDSSGNGLNLTAVGTPTFTADLPTALTAAGSAHTSRSYPRGVNRGVMRGAL